MIDKLTRRSSEAFGAARQQATADGNPHVDALHLLAALIEQDGGTAAPLLRAVGADPAAVLADTRAQLAQLPKIAGTTVSAPENSRALLKVLTTAGERAEKLNDEYISTEHLLVGLATDGGQAATLATQARGHARRAARGVREGARERPRHLRGPGRDLPGPGEVRGRPHPAGPRRPAGPGDRPGRGDPAGDPGAGPPHQEQPGPDRRARGRQDRRGRGPGAADRGRRRARVAARQAPGRSGPERDGRGREIPR